MGAPQDRVQLVLAPQPFEAFFRQRTAHGRSDTAEPVLLGHGHQLRPTALLESHESRRVRPADSARGGHRAATEAIGRGPSARGTDWPSEAC